MTYNCGALWTDPPTKPDHSLNNCTCPCEQLAVAQLPDQPPPDHQLWKKSGKHHYQWKLTERLNQLYPPSSPSLLPGCNDRSGGLQTTDHCKYSNSINGRPVPRWLLFLLGFPIVIQNFPLKQNREGIPEQSLFKIWTPLVDTRVSFGGCTILYLLRVTVCDRRWSIERNSTTLRPYLDPIWVAGTIPSCSTQNWSPWPPKT